VRIAHYNKLWLQPRPVVATTGARPMRILLATALSLSLPATALLAAGSNEETAPPKIKCEDGKTYDKKTKTCVNPEESNLDADGLYDAVRQLAYAGRYIDAQRLLESMPSEDDRRLTYMGFTHRKLGNGALAMSFYEQALARNPGNILARSYMGQGLVEEGNISAALDQLRAIRSHGGSGTWAEASLRTAIATGRTFNY